MITLMYGWAGFMVLLAFTGHTAARSLVRAGRRRLPRRDSRGRFVARRPLDRAPSLTFALLYGLWLCIRCLVTGAVRLLSAIGRQAYWTTAELWWSWQAWCEAPQLRDDELRQRAEIEYRRDMAWQRIAELRATDPTDPTKESVT